MNQFSPEEQDIIQSFEAGEWISQGTPERLKQLQFYAKNTDEQQITLTIATQDLKSIETQAKEQGISCEKLMSSILHKYLTGKLIEK
ncbi:antitoxin [Crocosphaera sp. XPORK-15E]|uniref:antitoxin n=1 Tax=Crocosphaera sp. XPORK-15E TaxID=3110247 RepID=UPI002B20DFE3|nr:antitoxin [Crocosphaera sp. XPORK-15E]MEA5532520.1 antitoxin [Crocosphaera sp. XPORK-15E]